MCLARALNGVGSEAAAFDLNSISFADQEAQAQAVMLAGEA